MSIAETLKTPDTPQVLNEWREVRTRAERVQFEVRAVRRFFRRRLLRFAGALAVTRHHGLRIQSLLDAHRRLRVADFLGNLVDEALQGMTAARGQEAARIGI